MKFIGRRVNRGKEKCQNGGAGGPGRVSCLKGPEPEPGENGILRKMSRFPYKNMDRMDRFHRKEGKEHLKEGNNIFAGLGERKGVRRHEKNNPHPDAQQNPFRVA